MNAKETRIKGLFEIQAKLFPDQRGYFSETFNKNDFEKLIPGVNFIQDNESKSSFGVLRGLHLQKAPYEQSKLIRVIEGEVLDVVVDLRKNSETFGESFSILLNETNKTQLFIPKGFAHGFVVLSQSVIFSYKVDNLYSPEHELGLIWDDDKLNIDWKINHKDIILSEKDKNLLSLNDYTKIYG
ncbi:MAG: dTDP-4-dehydrorhamnose 3,5-epimerase [Bacteroidota bacterium]